MTFKEAFAKARKEKGAGKTFTWNGKSYSTDYKQESSPTRPRARPDRAPTSSTRPKSRPTPTRPRARPTTAKAPQSEAMTEGLKTLSERSNPQPKELNLMGKVNRARRNFRAKMDRAEQRARRKLFPLYKADQR